MYVLVPAVQFTELYRGLPFMLAALLVSRSLIPSFGACATTAGTFIVFNAPVTFNLFGSHQSPWRTSNSSSSHAKAFARHCKLC